jgi:hypothetical protein
VKASRASGAGVEEGTLRLVVEVTGEGNLGVASPPPAGRLVGFHVYGTTVERASDRLVATYDVRPLDGTVSEVPSIPFAFFDPADGGAYRVLWTEPLPLPEGVSPAEPAGASGPPAEAPRGGAGALDDRLLRALWGLVAFAVATLLVLVVLAWRGRRRAPASPADLARRARSEETARALAAAVGGRGGVAADALAAWLGVRLDLPDSAVISPDLRQRLVKAGLADDLAAEAAATLEGLLAARYARSGTRDASDEAVALEADLVARLEQAFSTARPR